MKHNRLYLVCMFNRNQLETETMTTNTFTRIGYVAGVAYYEHPTMGDEAPLVKLLRDGEIVVTDFWELSDVDGAA